MSGGTAVLVIGIGLALTLLVGIASQLFGRAARNPAKQPMPESPPAYAPTREQQEDLDAVNAKIEEARSELHWLREQISRERTNLERLRRQAPNAGRTGMPPPPGPGAGAGPRTRQEQPAAHMPDSPWVILGLRPGASAEDIRRRYRLLSRVWHPDRFVDGPPELRAEAEVMMGRLNRAHNALAGPAAGTRR